MNTSIPSKHRTDYFKVLLILFVLFIGITCSVSASTSTSIFVATDRHNMFETVHENSDTSTGTANTDIASNKGSPPKETKSNKSGSVPPSSKPSGSGKESTTSSENSSASSGKKTTTVIPVYDENGNLIWHNNLTPVMELIAHDPLAVQPEVIIIGGDNVGGSEKTTDGLETKAPSYSVLSLDTQIARVFGPDVRTFYTYGSHDANETIAYTDAFFSGPAQGNGFYLYGISYAQMIYDTDDMALTGNSAYNGLDIDDPYGFSAQTAAHLFQTWINSLDDDWPIVVMSHVPLHAHRGDNSGAWTWLKALNTAAQHHDLIFLWGHNHTSETSKSGKAIEQTYYVMFPGQKLAAQTWAFDPEGKIVRSIQAEQATDESSTDSTAEESTEAYDEEDDETGQSQLDSDTPLIFETETLQFIYMNAGYIVNGVGTLLTFTDNDDDGHWDMLTAKRYALQDKNAFFGSTVPGTEWTFPLR